MNEPPHLQEWTTSRVARGIMAMAWRWRRGSQPRFQNARHLPSMRLRLWFRRSPAFFVLVTTAAAALVALGACRKSHPPGQEGETESLAAGGSYPVPDFDKPARPDSPRAADPRWVRARSFDPIDLAALADAEGAKGLLDGVDDGGEIARTALAALPFADDATAALGRLAEIAGSVNRSQVEPVLTAVLDVAQAAPLQRELLDPAGTRRCTKVLGRLAGESKLPARLRALALSAERLLADRGLGRGDDALVRDGVSAKTVRENQ